jgi:Domain of unknown function (DUF4389)
MIEGAPAYPATFTFDPPEKIANWRPLVQWLLAIPHFVILYVLSAVSRVISVVCWFVILFTGKLPDGLANLQVMYVRYSLRTFLYAGFMKDEYPPFAFDTVAADPGDDPRVRVDVRPQLTDRNRLTVALRIIWIIPQLIVVAFLFIALWVVYVIGFFAVLFTGKWPEGMRAFALKVMAWGLRVQAYGLLLTDEYPPFTLG